MKLNTKKTKGECECTCHLNPLNKTLGKVKYCSKCICMHTGCQPTEKQDILPFQKKLIKKYANRPLIATEKPMDWEERLNGLIPNAVFKVENENRKDKGIVTVDRSSVKHFIKDLLKDSNAYQAGISAERVNNPHTYDIYTQSDMDFKIAEYKQKLIKRIDKEFHKMGVVQAAISTYEGGHIMPERMRDIMFELEKFKREVEAVIKEV